MVLKLLPLPEAGLPPVAVHANVYGEVPPVADAVQLTAMPTVPLAGQLIVAVRVSAETVIVAGGEVAVLWVGLAESVTVRVIVYDPFVA